MITPLNIVALTVVTPVALALAGTPIACWREHRADAAARAGTAPTRPRKEQP